MSTYATDPPGLRREGDVRQRDVHIAMLPPTSGRVLGTVRPTFCRLRLRSTGI